MHMTLAQFRGYSKAVEKSARDSLLDAAYVARLAGAEAKDWKKLIEGLSDGD